MTNATNPDRSGPERAVIRVGITEWHGVAHEAALYPPTGVLYSDVTPLKRSRLWPIRSPIKGFLRRIESPDHDLVEALISPINTHNRWIYSLAHFAEAVSFTIFGLPVPRFTRLLYIKRLLERENCMKIVFWSKAGLQTLESYGGASDPKLLRKAVVVYPAIHNVPDEITRIDRARSRNVRILFSGDFFRKGGAHVVDAFERAQKRYPSIKLKLCCDEKRDFNTTDMRLRAKYLERIRGNPEIDLGRVSREEMIGRILPESDIYLLPTYAEAFGYAILEALAFGIPVISTTYFAIPEMIEDGVNGFLIDTRRFDCDRLFKGYWVNTIPDDFHSYMSEQLYDRLCSLLDSSELRQKLGRAGLEFARTRFSTEVRKTNMRAIYEMSLS